MFVKELFDLSSRKFSFSSAQIFSVQTIPKIREKEKEQIVLLKREKKEKKKRKKHIKKRKKCEETTPKKNGKL